MINKDNFNWYPLYTKSRHEKKAFDNLKNAGIDAYLPLMKSTRVWKDRKKNVETPLIPSYVFAKLKPYMLYEINKIYGISRYIKFNGRPATVREEDLKILQTALDSKTEIELVEGKILEGTKVRIASGPFAGYEGKVIENESKNKLIVELEDMEKSLLVTIEKSSLKIK